MPNNHSQPNPSTPTSDRRTVVTCPQCGDLELLRDSQLFWAICPTCLADMAEPEQCPLDNGGDDADL